MATLHHDGRKDTTGINAQASCREESVVCLVGTDVRHADAVWFDAHCHQL